MSDKFLETQYKLKKNPFESRVDLTAPMAGRKAQQKKWRDIVNSRRGSHANSLNFILGDYGLGKSYTLYRISQDFINDPSILSINLKFLPEDSVPKFGVDFITRIFSRIPVASISSRINPNSFEKLNELLPEIGPTMERFVQGNPTAAAFLSGEAGLTATSLRMIGARKKISATEEAFDYLMALLYLLKQAGIDSLILLIDEAEYVFSQMAGAKMASVINTLRSLYDLPSSPKVLEFGHPIANIIFFFGISRSGWTYLTNMEKTEQRRGGPVQPFMDRRESVIELTPLTEAETEELIEGRLKFNRTDGTQADKPLIPYTRDFVEYIFKLTSGHPRHIIERCDRVLIEGLQERVPILDEKYARKVLESYGFVTEPSAAK